MNREAFEAFMASDEKFPDGCNMTERVFNAGYQAGLASQAQQSQWISVEERLPEENTYVLCSYKRFGEWLVHEGRYNEKGDFTITIIDAKVRYWMPLPPAPEGGE